MMFLYTNKIRKDAHTSIKRNWKSGNLYESRRTEETKYNFSPELEIKKSAT